jgi:serine/threonine protein kinase
MQPGASVQQTSKHWLEPYFARRGTSLDEVMQEAPTSAYFRSGQSETRLKAVTDSRPGIVNMDSYNKESKQSTGDSNSKIDIAALDAAVEEYFSNVGIYARPIETNQKAKKMSRTYRGSRERDNSKYFIKVNLSETHLAKTEGRIQSRYHKKTDASAEIRGKCTLDVDGKKIPVIAMEYLEGEDFKEYLKTHEISEDKTVDLLLQVVEAIGEGHKEGLVHRDIKPSNIRITPAGDVKLLDWGIAVDTNSRFNSTHSRLCFGTPHYMSPEHVAGVVDYRMDFYSFGCMLFELITERTPFESIVKQTGSRPDKKMLERVIDIQDAMKDGGPINIASTEERAALDAAGDVYKHIITKCSSFDPEERYQSYREIADDLITILPRMKQLAHNIRREKRQKSRK